MHLFVIESVSINFQIFFWIIINYFLPKLGKLLFKMKRLLWAPFWITNFIVHRVYFCLHSWIKDGIYLYFLFLIFDSFYNYLFTFHFYKDRQVLLRETTHIKKKQFLRWILWLGLVIYFNKYNFDHSCILLEPSYFRIPNSNVNFRKNHLHTNSQIVCQSHEVSEITSFMKSWSTNSNSVNRFYESMKGKNHSPRMMQDIFIKAKVQEWQMLFKVIFI